LISDIDNDLSEEHLAWFTYRSSEFPAFPVNKSDDAILNRGGLVGGNLQTSSGVLTRGTGPTDELSSPYQKVPDKASNQYPQRLLVTDVYRLLFATLDDTNPTEREYNEKRKQTADAVKDLIMEYGAVAIAYYASFPDAMNMSNRAFYTKISHEIDHFVTVVGWDDEFAASEFNTPPPGSGAWLAKNSWGTTPSKWPYPVGKVEMDAGDGYFWLSYYDNTLENAALFQGIAPDSYKAMYLHDPLSTVRGWGIKEGTSFWGANIFEASEDEKIEAVAFYILDANMQYEVKIYTGVENGKPVSGTVGGGSTTGTLTYAGYHTIKLAEPVSVPNGQKFSIVVNLKRETIGGIYLGWEDIKNGEAIANPGESFYSFDSNNWEDSYSFGNFCIRALGNPSTDKVIVVEESRYGGGGGGGCDTGVLATVVLVSAVCSLLFKGFCKGKKVNSV
jgi:hypothetical protein